MEKADTQEDKVEPLELKRNYRVSPEFSDFVSEKLSKRTMKSVDLFNKMMEKYQEQKNQQDPLDLTLLEKQIEVATESTAKLGKLAELMDVVSSKMGRKIKDSEAAYQAIICDFSESAKNLKIFSEKGENILEKNELRFKRITQRTAGLIISFSIISAFFVAAINIQTYLNRPEFERQRSELEKDRDRFKVSYKWILNRVCKSKAVKKELKEVQKYCPN